MGRVKGRNIEGHILRGTSVDHTMYWSVVGLQESPKYPSGHEPEAAGIAGGSEGIDRGLNSISIPVNHERDFDGDLYVPDNETGIEGIEILTLTNEVSEEIISVSILSESEWSACGLRMTESSRATSPDSTHA